MPLPVVQVHAGAGQYESALESVFSAPPENGSVAPAGASSPQAGSAGGSLASQMEVADAVLRLVADNAGTPSIRCVAHCVFSVWYAYTDQPRLQPCRSEKQPQHNKHNKS